MITRRILAACTGSLLLAACGSKPEAADTAARADKDAPIAVDSAQRAHFTIEPVAQASFAPQIVTTGTVAFSADLSTQVLAPISGPVRRILTQPGAHVEPGEAMATVVSPDFATAVADYRKALAAWKNQKEITDLNEQLFKNDALARRELDQSRADLAGAVADRDAAVQALRALGISEKTIADSGATDQPIEAAIRAPIAGTVVEKLITPGQLLESGTPAFTVADVHTVWVMANVFERDIRAVHRGDKALIATDASPDTLVGRVDYVADLVDPATKATQVRLVVPNKGLILKRDMLVQVIIRSADTRKGLLVPVSAVLRDDENLPYLFLATNEGTFARRRVTVGGRIDDRYEITGGLAAGDKIVVDGGLYLQTMSEQQ